MNTVEFNKLHIRPGCRILDIGCGTGRHMGSGIGIKDVYVVGMDIDLNDLLKAKKRLIDLEHSGFGGSQWDIQAAEIIRMPFQDHSFDVVICSEVLEHVLDENTAVAEMVRILKPGGLLGISVPRYWPERICWKLSAEYRNTPDGHIRIYTKKGLKRLLEKAGLKFHESHYAHSLHTPYWWLKCLLGLSRDDRRPVNLYHRFLAWDIMTRPHWAQRMERLLNPLMGKSLVLYLSNPQLGSDAKSDTLS